MQRVQKVSLDNEGLMNISSRNDTMNVELELAIVLLSDVHKALDTVAKSHIPRLQVDSLTDMVADLQHAINAIRDSLA